MLRHWNGGGAGEHYQANSQAGLTTDTQVAPDRY
jgi:hypothetical protein